ncbi:MAG: hypothetical protein CBB66_06775 [bacterium TMED6]|nr:MAG: hypothetical protein CBB66_06775 [bacterium TMED6]
MEVLTMSNSKKSQFKYILLLNLIIGIHNIINYSINGHLTALIIGIINIGVWVILRDMRLIPVILKNINK